MSKTCSGSQVLAQLLRYRVVLVSFANELKGETLQFPGQIDTVGENVATVERRIFHISEYVDFLIFAKM